MSLVPSLLRAIVHVDGEALVMHAGDKPYVVAPTGQVELASKGLTLEAINGIVAELLPPEFQRALEEFDAVQCELPPQAEFPSETFTVVAARGGDDVWLEVRRRRIADEDQIPAEFFPPPAPGAPITTATTVPDDDFVALDESGAPMPHVSAPAPTPISAPAALTPSAQTMAAASPVAVSRIEPEPVEMPPAIAARIEPAPGMAAPVAPTLSVETEPEFELDQSLLLPDASQLWGSPQPQADARTSRHEDDDIPLTMLESIEESPAPVAQSRAPHRPAAPPPPPPPPLEKQEPAVAPVAAAPKTPPAAPKPSAPLEPVVAAKPVVSAPAVHVPVFAPPVVAPPVAAPPQAMVSEAPRAMAEPPRAMTPEPPRAMVPEPPRASAPEPPRVVAPPPTVSYEPPNIVSAPPPRMVSSEPPPSGVVLQMSRNPIRSDAPTFRPVGDTLSGLERLLRVAAARGASTLYLSSDEQPSVRVDGELQMIEGEPVLSSHDVVSLLLTLMPERSHEALRTGAATEWICDIEDVGRVRCMSFGDHRGPGGVFRLMPVRAVSADQLTLSREIQSLAIEPEGLVLIAGPRSSGKRTLIAALVDLINRIRRDHVITIEREVSIVHPRGSSFISQREVRGSDEDMIAAARAALREDPDVLVLEQVRNGAMMNVALEAAASGHLVIAGFVAHSATEAVDRILDLYAPEYGRQVQLALADNLRGVVAQVLLKKTGGGRVAAREILLNTAAVGSVIAEGKTSQLPMAIEGGRRLGMVPLSDSLVGFVQNGTVDAREAYQHVTDRGAFLSLLKRQGVDTSFVERLA